MARTRTITLKGSACKAFIEAMSGEKPKDERANAEQYATLIHMHVQSEQMDKAVALLEQYKRQS